MLNTILLQAASGNASAGAGSGWSSMIMIVALIAIFYFFMNAFRDSRKKGDKVMTAGGIYGRIREIKDNYVLLEIDSNVTIKIDKNSIYQSMEDVVETNVKAN